MRRYVTGFVLLFLFTVAGQRVEAKSGIQVLTTILPFKTFVEEVGKEHVEVEVLVPPGTSPHTWELQPHQLKAVSRADLYVIVGSGVEFEVLWEGKILELNREIVVCNSSEKVDLIESPGGHDHTHQTGTSTRYDPHVWLSPRNAATIVEEIARCLSHIDSSRQTFYVENAQTYAAKLDSLDRTLRQDLLDLSRPVFVLHPAWSYFARDYGLTQIPIEIEGKEITPKRVARVIDIAREWGATTVFVSPHTNPKVARLVADEFGGSVEYADPLAPDYITNLLTFSALLVRADE